MKVENMTSAQGNKVANQFIIRDKKEHQCGWTTVYFQSYQSVVVKVENGNNGSRKVFLDRETWDYSKTTDKYRNIFLGETKAETQKKIDSGEYVLTDLN